MGHFQTWSLAFRKMTAAIASCALVYTGMTIPSAYALGSVRIKDIAGFSGVRDNQLVGYGLVVGLNGTGDGLSNSPFTKESLVSMLERLGVNTRSSINFKTKNVAAVMVTANLPPFARHGTQIDVAVSALGEAKSLQGGTLLVTPLLAADGEVYAVAQGAVAISGFSAKGDAASVTRGVPTNGRISNGAIVEKEINFALAAQNHFRLSLRNPDFTTAKRVVEAINAYTRSQTAKALDPSTVELVLTGGTKDPIVFLTEIEQLRISPDQPAKVVIDDQNGVIVMGENVRISTVAISQGNLTIKVTETPQVSQPTAFSTAGATRTVNRTKIEVDDSSNKKMAVVKSGASLQELVNGLNALGIGPRDMITILQAVKAAGALQAEIEVMS